MEKRLFAYPLAFAALMALTACTNAPKPTPEPAQTQTPMHPHAHDHAQGQPSQPREITQVESGKAARNQCNAKAAQSIVGKPYGGPTMLEQARAAAGADLARMLRENSATTKEMQIGRLNVIVNAQGAVVRVTCG